MFEKEYNTTACLLVFENDIIKSNDELTKQSKAKQSKANQPVTTFILNKQNG